MIVSHHDFREEVSILRPSAYGADALPLRHPELGELIFIFVSLKTVYGGWFRSTDLQIMGLTGYLFPTPY